MFKPLVLSVVLFGQMALLPAVAAPFRANPVGDELKRVKSREILVTHQILPGTNVNSFTAVGVVNAPYEKTLRYYADPNNTKKFQTAIKKLDIIAKSEEYRRTAKYLIGLPWPLGDRNFTLDVWAVPEEKHIEWKLVEGDVKEFRGSYAVTPWGENQTLVSYQVETDLNTWVPPVILSWAQGRTIPNVITMARKDLETE